ncbi:MAG: protecting protein DprA [Acidobacteria bacterium]|nr:protecting protein DprA [Acidobacteriota bacterium]
MREPEDSQIRDAIELSLVPGIGLLAQQSLHDAFPRLSELLCRSPAELAAFGLKPESGSAISSRRYRPMAQEIFDWAHHEECRILIRGSDGYPALLREIYDPPLVLYCKGDLGILGLPSVAIVGTRRPTYYGLQVGRGIAHDLASRGIVVVSGLARGIDAAAHQGCLDAGGRTVAVLGNGIDVVYPREHRQLTRKILERGLLVSEFAPGTSPAPQNFPVRNRIISGISLGSVIVEASEYSGSLITARLAMEQNREVFAIPGNLSTPQSFGPNYLIKQGAKLVQIWRDIVEELPAEVRHRILSQEDAHAPVERQLELTTEEESRVLDMLLVDQATQFDRIVQRSGMRVPDLSNLLLHLEMRGLIRQVPGNLFIKAIRRPE